MSVWLVKTLLFSYSLLHVQAIEARVARGAFLKEAKFYGTDKRREFEYKFAVDLKNKEKISIKKLSQKIEKQLEKLIADKKFHFSKQVFTHYTLAPDFKSFVFKDTYLDTDNLDIQKSNSAYRLRYRWGRQERYYRHILFPFLSFFYPDRCEIQFKSGYERDISSGYINVQETRFEFRDESEPFLSSRNLEAPVAPWKEKEYLEYAQSGKYLGLPILPIRDLLLELPKNLEVLSLKPVIKVVTERFRTHLNIKTPWGVGPNPEQAFIITIDLVSAESLRNKKSFSRRLMEVEIEIDRNISTEIERVSKLDFRSDSIHFSAKRFSLEARESLHYDLSQIRDAVSSVLRDDYHLKPLVVNNKYSRLLSWLR